MNNLDTEYRLMELESQLQELQYQQELNARKSAARRRGFWWFIITLLTMDFFN